MTLLAHTGRGTLARLRLVGLKPITRQGLLPPHSPSRALFALPSSIELLPCRPFSVSCRNDVKPKRLMDFSCSTRDQPWTIIYQYQEWYIKRNFDADFSLKEFDRGAKQTFLVVSDILASDDVTPLLTEGFVEPNAFAEIKANHAKMNATQRRKFRVEEGTIWVGSAPARETISKGMETGIRMATGQAPKPFQFAQARVHQIRIINDDATESKVVEITIHFNVSPDVSHLVLQIRNNGIHGAKKLLDDELKTNTMEGYYRFYKDFNKDEGWILNAVDQHVGVEG